MIEILNGIHETISYNELAQFRLYRNRIAENYPLHWHTGIEIIFPLKNDYTVLSQKDKILLCEEDIIIINSGIIHGLAAPAEGERIIMQFNVALLHMLKEFEIILFMMPPLIVLRKEESDPSYHKIYQSLLAMIKEYEGKKAFAEAFIYAKLIEIYGELGRRELLRSECGKAMDAKKWQRNVGAVFRCCEYINQHYQENLTLEQIAELSGFSKYYFTRVFKQIMSVTFYEYLNQKRVERAVCLLAGNDLSITEIAMEAGFHSISSFNRTFKGVTGRAPREYRDTYQKSNMWAVSGKLSLEIGQEIT